MPRITPYFLLSNKKEEQARFKEMLSWGGGVPEDHFIEKDGKYYLNTAGTLLTSVVVEGSEDWYALFFYPNIGHVSTTRLNRSGQYEMEFREECPYGRDYPETLLGQKDPDQEMIDVDAFPSLMRSMNAGGEVTITYQSGRIEKKDVKKQTFDYYDRYFNIFNNMKNYEKNFVQINAERSRHMQQLQQQEIDKKLKPGSDMWKRYLARSFWAPNINPRDPRDPRRDDALKRTNSLPSLYQCD